MEIEPEEFEEYKIPQEPILKDETIELLKSMLHDKKMSVVNFLKAFPRKKRVEIVDTCLEEHTLFQSTSRNYP